MMMENNDYNNIIVHSVNEKCGHQLVRSWTAVHIDALNYPPQALGSTLSWQTLDIIMYYRVIQ